MSLLSSPKLSLHRASMSAVLQAVRASSLLDEMHSPSWTMYSLLRSLMSSEFEVKNGTRSGNFCYSCAEKNED
jgi:hypothetical protein